MSTFGRYFMHAPRLSSWEQRHRKHVQLRGLGADPAGELAADCWVRDIDRWQANNRYGMSDMIDGQKSGTTQWLGTMICPKADPWGRHTLYDIHALARSIHKMPPYKGDFAGPFIPAKVAIVAAGGRDARASIGRIEGLGYFDQGGYKDGKADASGGPGTDAWHHNYLVYDAEMADFARSHSAHGIAHKGVGAGAVLYAGLALSAINAGYDGNYSIEGTRSAAATALWIAAKNPKAGPLATQAKAAIARYPEGGVVPTASYTFGGDNDHCVDEMLRRGPNPPYGQPRYQCQPEQAVYCDTTAVTRTKHINFDYIDAKGILRWGLTVFHAPNLGRSVPGLLSPSVNSSKDTGGKFMPYKLTSDWRSDGVRHAFGSSMTSAIALRWTNALSNVGLELLSRANVNDSNMLAVVVTGALNARSPDLAAAFLRREDVAAVMLNASSVPPLSGLGAAVARDMERAATRAANNPASLHLPAISRQAEAFAANYPEF